MPRTPSASLRSHLLRATALLLLGGCDHPGDFAKEVVDARGDCTQDSLRVSSETCVEMFERYGEMATGAIHTYIGGVKAMDQALKRLPPANFDTAGLGHPFSVPPQRLPDSLGSAAALDRARRIPGPTAGYDAYPEQRTDSEDDTYDRYDEYDPRLPDGDGPDPYAGGDWQREGRTPVYDYPRAARPAAAPDARAPRPGVLLPPRERLGRPWLDGDDRETERPEGRTGSCDRTRGRECDRD